jgi:hypothetical protein
MKRDLFPELPDSFDGLSQEEIDEKLAAHRAVASKIHSRDEEFFAEHEIEPTDAEALVEEFQAGVVRIREMEDAKLQLAEAETNLAETLDSLAQEAGIVDATAEPEAPKPDDGDGNGDDEKVGEPLPDGEVRGEGIEAPADGSEVELTVATTSAEAEPEVVMASLTEGHQGRDHSSTGKRPLRLPPAGRRAPQENAETDEPARAQLVASAGVPGFNPGHTFDDRRELARALAIAFDRAQVAPGFRQDVVVASAEWEFPEERILGGPGSSAESDTEKIMDVCGPRAWGVEPTSGIKALLADGGICAAPTPFYDLPMISVADRPVRDGHPSFQAARGAVSVPGRLTLGDVTTAVGTVTAEEDGEGGTFSQKSCQRIDCDPYTDYEIVAHYACVEWGNFGARTWPERVATFADLVAAAHARMAETYLLDQIDNASTQVGAAEATYGYGAVGSLLSQILVAGDAMKSRHRANPNMRLRAVMPFWLRGMLVSDLRNSQFNRFDQSVAGVEALLEAHGISVIWHLDTSTGDGQIFGAQAAGPLLTYPDNVKWWLYPEGAFLFLDGGTLDLGIVRDSTLNLTNDFQVFFETFEQMAYLGIESLAITSALCANGATGGPATLIDCTP